MPVRQSVEEEESNEKAEIDFPTQKLNLPQLIHPPNHGNSMIIRFYTH